MAMRSAALPALLLCAVGSASAAGDPVPPNLAPPAGLKQVLEAKATGVQIYRCTHSASQSGTATGNWTLEGPRAELVDAQGKPVAHHYAGPTWEASDGSKITGKAVATAKSPQPDAVAWLLLSAQPADKPGRFASVRAVQRLHTSGGKAPEGACEHIGDALEVPYQATYVFWAAP